MNEDRKIDEAFLAEMMKRGKKAWEDVPDATAWVEDLRTDMTQNKMNDTPTPRTDALMPDQGHKRTIYEHIQVMETHARQLERELAEAKAELKKYTTDSGDDSLYNVRRLRKELTEAKGDAEAWKREAQISDARFRGEKHPDDNGIVSPSEIVTKLHIELAEVTKQRDALSEALEKLERTAGQSTLWADPARHNARKALAATKGGKP